MTAKSHTSALGTKATEIEMLENIMSMDGYFADTFTQDDLRIMKNNINNDFPILLATSVGNKMKIAEKLDRTITEMRGTIASRDCRIQDLEKENACLQNTLGQVLVDLLHVEEEYKVDLTSAHYTIRQVIKAKLQLGMKLEPEELRTALDALDRSHQL